MFAYIGALCGKDRQKPKREDERGDRRHADGRGDGGGDGPDGGPPSSSHDIASSSSNDIAQTQQKADDGAAHRIFLSHSGGDGGGDGPDGGPPGSSNDIASSSNDIAQTQQKADDGPAHRIFLSHSGYQKAFVEQLNLDLRRVNHCPFFDQSFDSLPKGEKFAEPIFQAARQCELAVVVVSHDYFESPWPMLELETFTFESSAKILPLFYKLSVEDCRRAENLSRWEKKWEELASKAKRRPLVTTRWLEAVLRLCKHNGENFAQGTSEVDYRRRIVSTISKIIPPHLPYDGSYVQGSQRMCEIVEKAFEDAQFEDAQPAPEMGADACVVGIFGVAGKGKTTLCKSLVNFYYSEYSGKSCLLEFPSDGDEGKILEQCKRVLQDLTKLSKEQVLEKATSLDQAVTLFRENIRRHKVFLAIDNVWDNSKEKAERIVRAGFGPGSKVVVTARSLEIVRDLLGNCGKAYCLVALPTLDQNEAVAMVKDKCGPVFLKNVSSEELLKKISQLAWFKDHYHPLVLKALCGKFRQIGNREGWSERLFQVFEQPLEHGMGDDVLSVLKTSYGQFLGERYRHIFLDVALCLPLLEAESFPLVNWLSILYQEEKHIKDCVDDLEFSGLLEVEGRYRRVQVHDLYIELAKREAGCSSRFLYYSLGERRRDQFRDQFIDQARREAVGEGRDGQGAIIKWEELERIVLLLPRDDEAMVETMVENVQRCSKVKLLKLRTRKLRQLSLQPMRSLRMLEIESASLESLEGWSEVQKDLAWLVLKLSGKYSATLGDIGCLTALQKLHIEGTTGITTAVLDLRSCVQLKELCVKNNPFLEELPSLGYLPELQVISFQGNGRVRKLFSFYTLPKLERLDLKYCYALEKVKRLGELEALKDLSLQRCYKLTEVPPLGRLDKLERLDMNGCSGLVKIPELRALSKLQSLDLRGCRSLVEIDGLNTVNLETLDISACGSLEKVLDLNLSKLQSLDMVGCGSLVEIGGLGTLTNLENLNMKDCKSLRKIPGLTALTNLKNLDTCGCKSLVETPGLTALTNLEELDISHCASLRNINLSALPKLQVLMAMYCTSLAEIEGLGTLTNLQELRTSVQNINLSALTNLEVLETTSFVKIEGLGTRPNRQIYRNW